MARAIIKLGLLIVCGLGVYISVLVAQTRAAANLCDSYPGGSRIEDLATLEGTFFLTQMGPIDDPNISGTQKVIFCASLTMCDTSCSLEIEDGVVKLARHSVY